MESNYYLGMDDPILNTRPFFVSNHFKIRKIIFILQFNNERVEFDTPYAFSWLKINSFVFICSQIGENDNQPIEMGFG